MIFIGTYVWVNLFDIICKILLNLYWVLGVYSFISYICPIAFKEPRVSFDLNIIPISYNIIYPIILW